MKEPGPLETAEGSTDIISPVCFLLASLPHSLNIDSIYNIFFMPDNYTDIHSERLVISFTIEKDCSESNLNPVLSCLSFSSH